MNTNLKDFLMRQWKREYLRTSGAGGQINFSGQRFNIGVGVFNHRLTIEELIKTIERLQERPSK